MSLGAMEKEALAVQPPAAARRRLRAWAAMLILALACALPLPARAADDGAKASAGHADISQGFARIVFDLTEEPKVDASIDFGVLVVKFGAPVKIDIDMLRTELGPYISLIRQDPDGTTLRFALRGPLRLVKSIVGRQVAIDLLPPRYQTEPPPFHGLVAQVQGMVPVAPAVIPSEAAERREQGGFAEPAALDLLPIRVGLNPTFTRLAFDWNLPVDYTVEHRGTEVIVRFSRAARVDLATLRTDPPKYVLSADAQITDGALSLIFELAPDVDAQDFRDGLRVVLDLTPKVPASERATITGPAGDDASALGEPKPLPGSGPSVTPGAAQPGAPASLGGDAQAALTGTGPDAALPHAAPAAPPPDAAAAVPPPPVPGHLAITGDEHGASLAVAFPEPVAAAAFRRGDLLWLVFDTDQPLTADDPPREVSPLMGAVAISAEDGAQILRIELKTDSLVQADADGAVWHFQLADTVTKPGEAITIAREVSPSGSPLLRLRAQAARLHWLPDPALGDFVLVATGKPPVHNVPVERHFVELSALATAAGVAVTPFTENLSARLEGSDVVIDSAGGLALTVADTADRGSTRSPVERTADPAYIDFAAWRRNGPMSLIPTRQVLERAIVKADEKHRNLARLDLARYYIANGYAAEAIGELRNMRREDPRIDNAAVYHALLGVGDWMMGRTGEAEKEFAHGSLAAEPDIAVWRGAAAASNRHWEDAGAAFGSAESTIARYPVTWQAQFRLLQAQTALARNDIPAAYQAFTAVPPAGLDPKLKAMDDYVAGRILEAQGRGDEGLARYALAAAGPRGEARARAMMAQADLSVKLGKMNEKKAIEILERVRYDWRGDTLELDALAELGRHYLADRRYRDGLSVMHSAVAFFPKEDGARTLAQEMSDAFRGLFLEGGADALPPIEALALFYDFRELTPLGSDGDDMVRRLAERLVLVDLLPQAEDLLQHQVDQRLQGAARAQVASRLSTIYLMDHKPEEALRAIRSTRQAQLPDWLDAERRLLESRALMDLKQYDFALEVLLNDTTPAAERIRADVYWGAGNWGAAAEHMEQVLSDRWRNAAPLDRDERLNVMRAAICYLFNKDDFGLSSLRERYQEKMKGTADAAAFELVTAKPASSSPDVGELAKRIASADTLDAFMKAFKASHTVNTGGVSTTAAPTN
jgi:hypothetical protein